MALQRNIAYIDLTTKKIENSIIPEAWRKSYLGGQGLATFLLHQHAPSGCDPLSPDNAIIISAGLLGGTVGSPPAQAYITTKSPLTGSCISAPSCYFRKGETAGISLCRGWFNQD